MVLAHAGDDLVNRRSVSESADDSDMTEYESGVDDETILSLVTKNPGRVSGTSSVEELLGERDGRMPILQSNRKEGSNRVRERVEREREAMTGN